MDLIHNRNEIYQDHRGYLTLHRSYCSSPVIINIPVLFNHQRHSKVLEESASCRCVCLYANVRSTRPYNSQCPQCGQAILPYCYLLRFDQPSEEHSCQNIFFGQVCDKIISMSSQSAITASTFCFVCSLGCSSAHQPKPLWMR